MSTAIDVDLGPGHIAQAFQIDGEMMCVLTPDAATDRAIQWRIRRLLKGQGVDCRSCCGCPVGTAE